MTAARQPANDARPAVERERTLIEAAFQQEFKPPVTAPKVSRIPDRIGPYRIVRELGAGGMGVVYEAEQEGAIRRRVALKVIKLGMDTGAVVRRFEAERQVLAVMDHPNVAKVFDAGATERGQPYFAMEFVQGTRITEYCDAERLSTRERLGLFVEVCHAIQHAHQKGIIHRDIKPSNVLVTVRDGKPAPVIIDFGIAKSIDHRLTAQTMYTEQGQLIGTPEYMSPEQAGMGGGDVDTRTDIYSLGALLYELLVGTVPYGRTRLRSCTLAEVQQIIRNEEPTRPSTRLRSLGIDSAGFAERRCTDVRSLGRELRGDLDWITMKALEKDRERRYASVSDLVTDLDRHLRHEPVTAGPPGAAYRFKKFVCRNRPFVIGGTAVFIVLIAGIVASTVFAVGQARARKEEQRRAYVANIALAGKALSEHDVAAVRRYLALVPEESRRNWEWRYLDAESDQSLAALEGHEDGVWCVTYSPDGRYLASASADGTIRIWNAATSAEMVCCTGHTGCVYCVAYSPDGDRLASASEDATVRIWDAASGEGLCVLSDHTERVNALTFNHAGRMLASGGVRDAVRIWDLLTGHLLHTLDPEAWMVYSLAFNHDDTLLAAGLYDKRIRIWDVSGLGEGAQPVRLQDLEGHDDFIRTVAFSADGGLLASGSADETIRIWNTSTWGLEHTLRAGRGVIQSVAFSPDGRRLAAGADDQAVRVWDLSNLPDVPEPTLLLGHTAFVQSVVFSPDGTRLASAGRFNDKTVRIWDAAIGEERNTLRGYTGRSGAWAVAAGVNGFRVALRRDAETIGVWDTSVDGWRGNLLLPGCSSIGIAINADGTRVATLSDYRDFRVWNALTGDELLRRREAGTAHALRFSPDGSRLVWMLDNREVRVWDLLGDKPDAGPVSLPALSGSDYALAFSPNGAFLVAVPGTGTARVWSVSNRTSPAQTPVLADLPRSARSILTFSPDSNRLALGWPDDQTIAVWDTSKIAATSEPVLLAAHGSRVSVVEFNPDGSRLAAGCDDGSVHVWDLDAYPAVRQIRVLHGHESSVRAIVFSPDGGRLVSGTEHGTLRVWDPLSGDMLLVLRGAHRDAIRKVAFSADGTCLLSCSQGNIVHFSDSVRYRDRCQER
jgi:WD40 repeat protein/serine/threonine protein kinase